LLCCPLTLDAIRKIEIPFLFNLRRRIELGSYISLSMNNKTPVRISRNVIYENPWVNLYVDKVVFPGGRVIDQHHVLEFEKEAVAVLVENKYGQIVFVQAYRYPTDSIEWEIPSGSVERGEKVLEAARREVFEETGYDSAGHELIYTFNPMNGIANQVFHLVRCRCGDKAGEFDRNEIKSVLWVSREEIQDMIREKQIRDGYSLTALLLDFFLKPGS